MFIFRAHIEYKRSDGSWKINREFLNLPLNIYTQYAYDQ